MIEGVDFDLIIKPFTHKGVIRSLRNFTLNAMNHHSGMQAEERFGPRWTGTSDFDEDGFTAEMSQGEISALVAWQATLPPPVRRDDLSPDWAAAAQGGEGCSPILAAPPVTSALCRWKASISTIRVHWMVLAR